MGLKVTIREKDRGLAAMRRAAKEMKGSYVKVGVLGGSKNARAAGDPVSNVDLAIIHEFGSPAAGIPERSFVRSTFESKRAEYLALLRRFAAQVYEGKSLTWRRAFGLVGAKAAADIKNRVTQGAGIPPPNAPATVASKGSDRPLVDTNQLVNSVTWAFVKGGK